MKRCACCGGGLGPHPIGLKYRGRESEFCSFGCVVVQAAPACWVCGAKVLGRGIDCGGGRIACSTACARPAAATP